MWRLRQRDYGNTNGEAISANLRRALEYIIVVLQGVHDHQCFLGKIPIADNGVFDTSRKKRLSNITDSFTGLMYAVLATVTNIVGYTTVGFATAVILVPIQIVIYAAILCPIFALYISGPYVPIWLAVWRLRHRDYGNTNGEAISANLQRALDVLYILVVVQGVLVYYMTINAFSGKSIVQKVVDDYGFGKWASTAVWDYLDDTRKGCAKDPSFAEGRTLVKYAMDLVRSESADRKLSGARILDTIIEQQTSDMFRLLHQYVPQYLGAWWYLPGQHMHLKQLIIESESSDDIIQKLLQMLDSRSPYDKEMRRRTARVVAYLAADIHLKQFPLGIQWIASLLDTFQEYSVMEPYQRDWLLHACRRDYQEAPPHLAINEEYDNTGPEDGYKDLVLQGLRILRRLATNEDNCVIMSSMTGLLTKIMAPISSDLVHSYDHSQWYIRVMKESMRAMGQLATAPGEIGKKLRHEISSNKEAIAAIEGILECLECGDRELHQSAIAVLTELYVDTSSGMDTASRDKFMKRLLDIFLKAPRSSEEVEPFFFRSDLEELNSNEMPARVLMRLSFEMEDSATIILKEKGNIVNDLIKLLQHTDEKSHRRVTAAVVLERLYIYYTGLDTELNGLNKATLMEAVINAIPKVLREILCHVPPRETQEGTKTNQVGSPVPKSDIENPSGETQESSGGDESNFMRLFIPASLSLIATVCGTCITVDQASACQINAIAAACAPDSVPRLLKDMVIRNMDKVKRNMDMVKRKKGTLINRFRSQDMIEEEMRSRYSGSDWPLSENNAYYLKIVKLVSKMSISMIKHGSIYDTEDLDSLIKSLADASKKMSILDASMLFASNEDGAWRVPGSMLNRGEKYRSLKSLVDEVQEEFANKNKAQASDIE
ncbi:hypothetical protein ACP4OV_009939 [Aristida adscensionis]